MKKTLNKMAICVFAIAALATTLASATPAIAKETTLTLKYSEVIDTYYSFSTANAPQHNKSMYNPTYRRLAFKNSYARTGQDILWTSMALCPDKDGQVGFETKYKCTYKTW